MRASLCRVGDFRRDRNVGGVISTQSVPLAHSAALFVDLTHVCVPQPRSCPSSLHFMEPTCQAFDHLQLRGHLAAIGGSGAHRRHKLHTDRRRLVSPDHERGGLLHGSVSQGVKARLWGRRDGLPGHGRRIQAASRPQG